jgi:acetyl esterase/lipase
MSDQDHFTSDPEWNAYAANNGFPLPSKATAFASTTMQPISFDITAARDYQDEADRAWAASHPLESFSYVAQIVTVKARDGSDLNIKISHPKTSRLSTRDDQRPLPVLFVNHGGGYISGSHISEEAWLLWPLYEEFDFVIISVEYRLAPEHKFPAWIEDSWDVLRLVLSHDGAIFSSINVQVDLEKVFLAGSSAGAGICAVLSHMCRDEGIIIAGVILNVPMLCDYRHLPDSGPTSSYRRCCEELPSTRALLWTWELLHPSPIIGSNIWISPLLGDCKSLSRHAIFVAGQDPLFDEGIAYAQKLQKSAVLVDLKTYVGLPHHFAQFWELNATKRFWAELRDTIRIWLN